MDHKAGFVNIIGKPNVGKSTLMNAFIGEKLSITTSKAQTTRHRILGILNNEEYQVVFSDTPGILKPKYKLQEKMMTFLDDIFSDADILLYMTDNNNNFEEKEILEKLKSANIPVIIAINKIDLSDQEKATLLIQEWKSQVPNAEIFAISALRNFNIKELIQYIVEKLPEHEPFYPKEELSDKNIRFFVSEIIREQILINYQKEIPYSVEVVIEAYTEAPTIDRIQATIYVERDSQKAIIIGHKGESIKRVGTYARKDIEKLVGKQVFLELFVKVKKDWRNNDNMLKQFGYR